MSNYFIYNDKKYKSGTGILSPDNRTVRYGDGLFETLKINNRNIQLEEYHFERLFAGMKTLQLKHPKSYTADYFKNKIFDLCKRNRLNASARVRLMVFRGDGGLYDSKNDLPNYIIQTWDVECKPELNSNGIIIDIYNDAKKSCDIFSNIKNNNFLPYTMAALFAQKIKANDCILLNNYDRICDTTIANIFIIKDGIIYTPSLSEGCIAGVTRRFILEGLGQYFKIIEKPCTVEELQNADEVFLSNSIKGIRWVRHFKNIEYTNILIKDIHALYTKTIH